MRLISLLLILVLIALGLGCHTDLPSTPDAPQSGPPEGYFWVDTGSQIIKQESYTSTRFSDASFSTVGVGISSGPLNSDGAYIQLHLDVIGVSEGEVFNITNLRNNAKFGYNSTTGFWADSGRIQVSDLDSTLQLISGTFTLSFHNSKTSFSISGVFNKIPWVQHSEIVGPEHLTASCDYHLEEDQMELGGYLQDVPYDIYNYDVGLGIHHPALGNRALAFDTAIYSFEHQERHTGRIVESRSYYSTSEDSLEITKLDKTLRRISGSFTIQGTRWSFDSLLWRIR